MSFNNINISFKKILKNNYYIICSLLILLFNVNLNAQSGMKFVEFAEKLEQYYDNSLIMDIKKSLPQTDYYIWGWDVGDFSGDGHYDVAFAVKIRGDKKNRVLIYLFVDVEGFLTQVGQFNYTFVDLPLENGVVIKNNTCYLTQKIKQFNWIVKGYTFDKGNLILVDEFETEKAGNLTKETYTNYKSMISSDKLISIKNNKVVKELEYLNIPCYPRTAKPFYGITNEIFCNNIEYVPKGAFYWTGEEDASFKIQTHYDEKYLYFNIEVFDDKVVPITYKDSISGDCIELWLNADLYKYKGTKEEIINEKRDTNNIIKFTVFPGDFFEIKPYLEISTNLNLDTKQRLATQSIKASSNIFEKGYVVKFKIPFMLLGIEELLSDKTEISEIKATLAINDVDNEFYPEQNTYITSSLFDKNDFRTYSTLLLIPNNIYFGENYNVFLEDVLKNIGDFGY